MTPPMPTPAARTAPDGHGALRLAVYGGSFNPPHVGHEETIAALLGHRLADRVLVLPVFEHPFGKTLAPFDDRLAMCRLAFARLGPRVEVLDTERHLGGVSYTVRTLEHLRAERPADQLRLVVGADTLRDAADWKDFERVRALAPLLIIPRRGEKPSPETLPIPAPPFVSSTEIRRRLAAGEPVPGLLSPAVETYIRERRLYGAAPVPAEGPGEDGEPR